jgi:hypothetical protein
MTLTAAQRASLVQAYAPILLFHPDERFVPIRPDSYLLASALWRGDQTGNKSGWGLGGPAFPRKPLIPRGGISLKPSDDVEGASDPDGDGVNDWYLGHFESQRGIFPYLRSLEAQELWLDCAGWNDGDDVTDRSANEACNLDKLEKRFVTEPELMKARHWYFAEVMEIEELDKFFVDVSAGPTDAERLLRGQFGDVWIIWYYFLYPGHEEFLRRCEAFFDKKSDGDYEGDWNAVGVLVQRPATLPWEMPQPVFPTPSRLGYGVRLRGLAKDIVTADSFKQGMTVHRWDELEKNGLHARVYVARGYHNNYATPGTQVPRDPSILGIEVGKLACGVGEGASAISDTVKDTLADAGETVKDVLITLAKIVAGAAAGGPFGVPLLGAIGGLIAGIVEANASSAPHQPSADDWRVREQEHPPDDNNYGLVLTPPEVSDPLDRANPDPAKRENAKSIVQWAGTPSDKLVDRTTQLWWPNTGSRPPGYSGRWGVRVQQDPNLRRSGIPFPDFRRAFLRELLEATVKD